LSIKIGWSGERVRQLEAHALQKIRWIVNKRTTEKTRMLMRPETHPPTTTPTALALPDDSVSSQKKTVGDLTKKKKSLSEWAQLVWENTPVNERGQRVFCLAQPLTTIFVGSSESYAGALVNKFRKCELVVLEGRGPNRKMRWVMNPYTNERIGVSATAEAQPGSESIVCVSAQSLEFEQLLPLLLASVKKPQQLSLLANIASVGQHIIQALEVIPPEYHEFLRRLFNSNDLQKVSR
jgi:hypothetical protein